MKRVILVSALVGALGVVASAVADVSGGTPTQRHVLIASLSALKAGGISVEISPHPKELSLRYHRHERTLIFSGAFDAESQWKSLIAAGVFAARGIGLTWVSVRSGGIARYHHVAGRFDPATRAEVVRTINRAADAAGVRVDAITLFHPLTFAPVVTITVPDRKRFERQGGLRVEALLDHSKPRVEGVFLIARDRHGHVWSRGGIAVRLGTGAGTWPGSIHG